MTLAPPGVARRWSIVGHKHDGWECTTLFDLPHRECTYVIVHPAAVNKYTVTLYRSGANMLLETIDSGNACAVPVIHEHHGERLLGLRPITLAHETPWTDRPADAPPHLGPMELYLHLPDAQLNIIFRPERLLRLATILTDIMMSTERSFAR